MKLETLDEIADAVHNLAKEKGWYDAEQTEDAFVERACNNLHDEVSELHEAWRNGVLWEDCDKADKMREIYIPALCCAEEELADIIIRVLDTARRLSIDIAEAVRRKHAFNMTRPVRHGGKKS